MRFAYADPPYLGCCALYGHEHGDSGLCWDDLRTHHLLIARLYSEYPDGWALSCSVPSLAPLLLATSTNASGARSPNGVRIGAWVKTFCAFEKGVRPAYAWEPVLFYRGRNPPGYRHEPPPKNGKQTTPKDFAITPEVWESPVLAEPITLRRGLTGAKPEAFAMWVFALLNAQQGDELVDLFPGTGAVTRAWEALMSKPASEGAK